ncbi:MAG: DUF2946 family protein [Georgfuchsia sp.]
MLKRFVLLLLLVVVPFQMAWAVPSSYCQHEQDATAQHFGHHTHQHQDSGKVPGSVDDDCAYCHLGGVILPLALLAVTAPPLLSVSFSSCLEAMSSVLAREPERPKWTLAA